MLKIGGEEGQITQEEPQEELQEELQEGELSRNLKSHTETQAGGSFIRKIGGRWVDRPGGAPGSKNAEGFQEGGPWMAAPGSYW